MPDLELIAVQFDYTPLLNSIGAHLHYRERFNVSWRNGEMVITDCYDERREQYDAAKILKKNNPHDSRHKAIIYTSQDIYIPILTFVFGLAGLGGPAAIVSSFRLRNEFYGLPADENKLIERLIKETVHEYGHLQNLRHCHDYRCVMASSTTVDDLDIKGDTFCPSCQAVLSSRPDNDV